MPTVGAHNETEGDQDGPDRDPPRIDLADDAQNGPHVQIAHDRVEAEQRHAKLEQR